MGVFEYKDFLDAQVILIIIYHLYLDLVTGSIFCDCCPFQLETLAGQTCGTKPH